MKKFVLKTCLFSISIVLLAYAFDFFISANLKKARAFAEGETAVWEDIYNGNVHSDILIYGSSRAYVHVDPILIQDALHTSCYNFGVNGHNFQIQYLRHLEHLKHNQKPKVIIVSVDAFALEKRLDLYNHIQFLPYLDKENVQKFTSSYVGFSFWEYHIPLLKYYGENLAVKKAMATFMNPSSDKGSRIRGYQAMDKEWTNALSKAKGKKELYTATIDVSIQTLFEQFLTECQEKEIRVILTYAPLYIDGQEYIENHEEIIAYYEKIASDFKIPFLSYLDKDLCSDKEYFYNSMHLNKKGSQLFTKMLIEDIRISTQHILQK